MSSEPNPRIAIIGGGLSGLATAVQLHLALPRATINVLEAADRIGGVIHTERAEGFLIDHGADMFSTNPPAAIELCHQLGVENRLIEPQLAGRGARIVCGSNLVPLPEGFVLMRATQLWPMLTTPLLSLRGKLRFLAERWIRSLEPDHKTSADADDESSYRDESVSDFVRRRMGQEVLDRIVAPLSAGIYTADITKLSMQATMGPIAKMERDYGSLARATAARRRSGQDSVERSSAGARYSQFRAFQGGMIELISSLAHALAPNTIRTNSPVQSIRRSEGTWTVHWAEGESMEFDHVVVAVPPAAASRLLRPHAPTAADELSKIESASVAIVVLGVRRSEIERDINTFGFVVPLTEKRRILAGSFASNKFAGRAPEGHVLIRVFVGGAMQPELLKSSDEEITRIVREELADLIGYRGEPLVTRVVRWDRAMPQYHVGHLDRVKRIEQAIDQVDGLSLMSNALHGVGIAPVIGQADRVASKIAARWQASSNPSSGEGA